MLLSARSRRQAVTLRRWNTFPSGRDWFNTTDGMAEEVPDRAATGRPGVIVALRAMTVVLPNDCPAGWAALDSSPRLWSRGGSAKDMVPPARECGERVSQALALVR